MDSWQVVKTPPLPGIINMQVDLETFKGFEKGEIPSTIHIYSWQKSCISLGYSQKIEEEIDIEKADKLGWDVVKRPTGGGIVFHNEAEVTYSLVTGIDNPVLPKGLVPSYKKISEAIISALKIIGITVEIQTSNLKLQNKVTNPKSQLCFSYPAEYEIVVAGKKIVGSAQKRGKKALLQQGSIFVRRTSAEAFSVLKRRYDNVDAVSVEEVLGRDVEFEELSNALVEGFEEKLGIKFG